MDAEDRRLLNEIHGNTAGMKALVELHGADLQRLSARAAHARGEEPRKST
jgi:hypothetical protein